MATYTFTHASRNLIEGNSSLYLEGDDLVSRDLVIQRVNLEGRASVKSYNLDSRKLLIARVPHTGRFSQQTFNHASRNLVIQRSVLLGKLTGVKLFPEVVPSQVRFKPAKFVVTEHKAQSGEVEMHLWTDSNAGATLQLNYINIPDSTAETIMALWDSVYGTYSFLKIPITILTGVQQELKEYILSGGKGAKWFFTEAPSWEGRLKGYGDLTVNLVAQISLLNNNTTDAVTTTTD